MTFTLDDRTGRSKACPSCGDAFEHVNGFISLDDRPHSVYFAAAHGHAGMETQVDVVLGTWGVDPPIDDHLTFSCRLGSDGAIAADAALTVDGEHASLGRLLTRAEALTHPRVEEFWAVVDFLAEADPTIRAGIQGDDQPAWPFDQGPDVAALTVQAVLSGDPILHVSHDEDDHGWQFLDGRAPDVNAGRLIRMSDALARDPSLRAIADLPPGWIAWRTHPDAPWQRGAHPS